MSWITSAIALVLFVLSAWSSSVAENSAFHRLLQIPVPLVTVGQREDLFHSPALNIW